MSNYKNEKIEEYSEVFKALSNPNRLKIFIRLASCCRPGTVGYFNNAGTAYIGQLSQEVDVVKSTVSHHIKELRRVGLIQTERRGQKIACWVAPDMVTALKDFFEF